MELKVSANRRWRLSRGDGGGRRARTDRRVVNPFVCAIVALIGGFEPWMGCQRRNTTVFLNFI